MVLAPAGHALHFQFVPWGAIGEASNFGVEAHRPIALGCSSYVLHIKTIRCRTRVPFGGTPGHGQRVGQQNNQHLLQNPGHDRYLDFEGTSVRN